MISAEENELLTAVGPGTPGGEMLRRYWHVVCPVGELAGDQRTRRVLLLGEKLVAYRDRSGTYGLLEERCAHRNATLADPYRVTNKRLAWRRRRRRALLQVRAKDVPAGEKEGKAKPNQSLNIHFKLSTDPTGRPAYFWFL